jgi:hypothetical protein
MNSKRPHKPATDSEEDPRSVREREPRRDRDREREHRGPERELEEPNERNHFRRRLEDDELKIHR